MNLYTPPNKAIWTGRSSGMAHYMHEVVNCINIAEVAANTQINYGLLGYACEEGVRRNFGRIGSKDGPDAIRQQLAKMPSHLSDEKSIFDLGNIVCVNGAMEIAQEQLGQQVQKLLSANFFPILLGGGHDIAYGQYLGIMASLKKGKTLGIINLDAHFDLRDTTSGSNSGTPFFQIAEDSKKRKIPFHYMCLGIRADANDQLLYSRAQDYGVRYIKSEDFSLQCIRELQTAISDFVSKVDYIYLTIDLDGFSSAFAPGVSAASPMGFTPDIALKTIRYIFQTGKVISADLAEMNPAFDRDHQTAKLAASLVHFMLQQ